jgi:hypothetical protein
MLTPEMFSEAIPRRGCAGCVPALADQPWTVSRYRVDRAGGLVVVSRTRHDITCPAIAWRGGPTP